MELLDPISQKITSIDEIKRTPINSGQCEKARIQARILSGDRRAEMSIVIKRPFFKANHYIDIWKRMNDAQIPVVPQIWKIDEETIAMPDLAESGAKIYDKHTLLSLRSEQLTADYNQREKANIRVDDVDRKFIHLINTSWGEIEEQITQAVEKLDKANISLAPAPDDSFAIIMYPSGSWKMITLDIDKASVTQTPDNTWIKREFPFIMTNIVKSLENPAYRIPRH